MVSDREQQLYQDMANLREKVPKLQNEVKYLKAKLTKLSNRIERLELMAFQDQITELSDKINSISTKLLDVSRAVAFNEMDVLSLHMREAIDIKFANASKLRTRLREYISAECAKAIQQRLDSPEPLAVSREFKTLCIECSDKYQLDAFVTKP